MVTKVLVKRIFNALFLVNSSSFMKYIFISLLFFAGLIYYALTIVTGGRTPDPDSIQADSSYADTLPQTRDSLLQTNKNLSPPNNKIPVDAIVDFAETLEGTPYLYASSDPQKGFDCSGFITYVFNHFGFSVPRSSVEFTNRGTPVMPDEAKRGNLILFTGTDSATTIVGHMGIVTSNTDSLRFIHSSSGKANGVTVSSLNKHYRERFVKIISIENGL